MSFFDDVDVNDISDDPNKLPNNTYLFKITSAKFGPTNDGNKTGITFKYQIVEGAYSTFFPLTDWVRVPDKNTRPDEKPRMLSYLKMRLLAFGYTPDEIQGFGPKMVEDCIGREFFGTTSSKKDPKTDNNQIRVHTFAPRNSDDDLDGLNEFSDSPDI